MTAPPDSYVGYLVYLPTATRARAGVFPRESVFRVAGDKGGRLHLVEADVEPERAATLVASASKQRAELLSERALIVPTADGLDAVISAIDGEHIAEAVDKIGSSVTDVGIMREGAGLRGMWVWEGVIKVEEQKNNEFSLDVAGFLRHAFRCEIDNLARGSNPWVSR